MAPTETKPDPPVRSLPPVMDVRPPKTADVSSEAPKAEAATPPATPAAPTPEPVPVEPKEPPKDAVKEPPLGSEPDRKAPPKLAHAKPVRSHNGSGVGAAVFATMVIVLGLGILMVYAYLRSNGISVL